MVDQYCKASTLAPIMGISKRQVELFASEGIIPKAVKGKGYDLIGCLQAYIHHQDVNANITNAEGLAELFNISTGMVYKLVKQGMPLVKRGKYDKKICTQWYMDSFRDKLKGRGESNIDEERMGLIVEQRRKAKMDADKQEQTLIPIKEMDEGFSYLAGLIASQLSAMPGRLAGEVSAAKTPGEARKIIDGECRSIKREVAKALRDKACKIDPNCIKDN